MEEEMWLKIARLRS